MSPGLAGSAKRENPAASHAALRAPWPSPAGIATTAEAFASASNASGAISRTSPSTVIDDTAHPANAPGPIDSTPSGITTASPAPGGHATSAFMSFVYSRPFRDEKDVEPSPTRMQESPAQCENAKAGTISVWSGSMATPSLPSGTSRRFERSFESSMPSKEA